MICTSEGRRESAAVSRHPLPLLALAVSLVSGRELVAQSPVIVQQTTCDGPCPGETAQPRGPSPVNPYVSLGAQLGYMIREKGDFSDNLLATARVQWQLGGKKYIESHPHAKYFLIGNLSKLRDAILENPKDIEKVATDMMSSKDGINAMLSYAHQTLDVQKRTDEQNSAAAWNFVVYPAIGYKLNTVKSPADSSIRKLNQLRGSVGFEIHRYRPLADLPWTVSVEGVYQQCVTSQELCKDIFGDNRTGRPHIEVTYLYPLGSRLPVGPLKSWSLLLESAAATSAKPLYRAGFVVLK